MTHPGGGPYRRAKVAIEERLLAGSRPALILQPTIVWGPGSSLWTDRFAQALMAGSVILPDPQGLCQGVFVEDVVQACLRAALVPDPGRERFIINGQQPFRWSDLIGGYRDILGRGTVRFEPANALRPAAAPVAPGEDEGPSLAARISALGRRIMGRERFEALVRTASYRMSRNADMRPDAHLLELMSAQGACPPDAARARLGYAPEYGLAEGLAATSDYLRAIAARA